jgi:hypothetical protein
MMGRRFLALATLLAALAIAASLPAVAGGRTTKIVEAQTMVGVPTGLTGAAGAIGSVNGAGLPWVIGTSKAELAVGGRFELTFSDLLFADEAAVPVGLRGTNNQATMRAGVSCLTTTGARTAVLTPAFPVTTGPGAGDGSVEATLALPSPCVAPVILITNAAGSAWFAASGD